MNRRSMLGMLGLGAAAGPAVVSQAVSASPVPWEQSTVQTHGIGYSIAKETYNTYDKPWNPVEALASAKREYSMMTDEPSKWIADYVARDMDEYVNGYSSFRLDNIDPDIRNMKSFSEMTKLRMHIERKAKRRLESQKNHLWARVQELMKEI
jgi:hypothetical protein